MTSTLYGWQCVGTIRLDADVLSLVCVEHTPYLIAYHMGEWIIAYHNDRPYDGKPAERALMMQTILRNIVPHVGGADAMGWTADAAGARKLAEWLRTRYALSGDPLGKTTAWWGAQPEVVAAPVAHARNHFGWLCCSRCGEASQYAEPPASGPFTCGQCKALGSVFG